MQLNESAQKLDAQLDQVCKKLEKVAFDTSADSSLSELRYYEHFNQSGGGSKFILTSSHCFLLLPGHTLIIIHYNTDLSLDKIF